MEQVTVNQMFWEVPTSTRPATLAEMAFNNALDLLNGCEPEMHAVHTEFIRKHVDNLEMVNAYCVQELTSLDSRDYGKMVRELI